jgi:hypothetical protein
MRSSMQTAPRPSARRPAPDHGVRRAGSAEVVVVRSGLGLLALHVLDDNYLQPAPGTTPGDHLLSGLVPLALLMAVAMLYPRLRAARSAAIVEPRVMEPPATQREARP